ncbi:MAG: DUF4198 domain-containing protein, partial [Alphaproteobacteria bacterium]
FKEGYTRFAKSLIAVGDGAGHDIATGMPLELVALANPYTDDMPTGLPVRLLFNSQGLPRIKVKIFHRLPDGVTVENSYVHTNTSGLAVIPVDGKGVYMINAVHMIPTTEDEFERTEAVWHSLWASMTFEIN